MSQMNEDKLLNDLYQQANQEQPPKTLDDLILQHAKSSTLESNSKPVKTINHLHPWFAAASVVLVLPLIWLLTQNQELRSEVEQIKPVEIQPQIQSKVKTKPMSSANVQSVSTDEVAEAYTDKEKATDPSKYEEVVVLPAPMIDLPNIIEQEGSYPISKQTIDRKSLQANKELLMNEFKAKKRSIRPSTMDPLMALEYEQFGRYLERGEIEAADQLLTDMQENWPEFDFEDMIYRLAEAEITGQ